MCSAQPQHRQLLCAVTVSEMVFARFALRRNPVELARLRRHESETLFGVQIATNQIAEGVNAGRLAADQGADFLDLNCGCPIHETWKRGLGAALLKKPAKTMKECCNAAYAASLKRHHNFVMKSAFSVAVNAAPSREEFLGKLAPSAGAEAALKTLARLQPMFTKQLDAVESYLVARKIER